MRRVLEHLSTCIRSRNRADCPLRCKGHRRGTVAFNDRFWKCHRCDAGGDVFTLIELVHHCSFRDALKYLAQMARVELARTMSREGRQRLRQEWAEHKRREEEVDQACAELAHQERLLRVQCARYIFEIDYLLSLPAPWTEEQWSFAAAISELRNEDLLPTYTLLTFGAVGMRVRYILANETERAAILSHVRWADGCYGDDGHFVEMVTT